MEIKVTGCHDCPFKKHHYGHGESWDYCEHKQAPEGYGSILDQQNPKWCPLKKDAVVIYLKGTTHDDDYRKP